MKRAEVFLLFFCYIKSVNQHAQKELMDMMESSGYLNKTGARWTKSRIKPLCKNFMK
jgi:hypothetical protein